METVGDDQPAETVEGSVICDHDDFQGEMKFFRLRDGNGSVNGYTVDITATCGRCGKPIYWIGMPMGYSPGQPMVSADGKEMRAPFAMVGGLVRETSETAVMQKIEVEIVRASRPTDSAPHESA